MWLNSYLKSISILDSTGDVQNLRTNGHQPILQCLINVAPTHLEVPQLCSVCNSPNVGNHCEARTCSACAQFFRNNFYRNYTCILDNACDVTLLTRAQCSACRMRKCDQVGMRYQGRRHIFMTHTTQVMPWTQVTPNAPSFLFDDDEDVETNLVIDETEHSGEEHTGEEKLNEEVDVEKPDQLEKSTSSVSSDEELEQDGEIVYVSRGLKPASVLPKNSLFQTVRTIAQQFERLNNENRNLKIEKVRSSMREAYQKHRIEDLVKLNAIKT